MVSPGVVRWHSMSLLSLVALAGRTGPGNEEARESSRAYGSTTFVGANRRSPDEQKSQKLHPSRGRGPTEWVATEHADVLGRGTSSASPRSPVSREGCRTRRAGVAR